MTRMRWIVGTLVPLAGCLSSAPPLPPVRWFDPLPVAVAATAPLPQVDLRVTAVGHLGREFVVRTAPREVVFDGQHGWIDDPAQLVAAALEAKLDRRDGARLLLVTVTAFELDVQHAPRAVVRLVVQREGERWDVDVQAPAADRSPAALAAAMAAALDEAGTKVVAAVRGD
jgi:hypothetical protein